MSPPDQDLDEHSPAASPGLRRSAGGAWNTIGAAMPSAILFILLGLVESFVGAGVGIAMAFALLLIIVSPRLERWSAALLAVVAASTWLIADAAYRQSHQTSGASELEMVLGAAFLLFIPFIVTFVQGFLAESSSAGADETAASPAKGTLNENLLRLIAHAVDSATEMISITDAENRFIFVNRAFLESYGYTREEILGQKPSILRLPQEDGTIGAEISSMTREGGWDGELYNVRKDGSVIPVHLSTSIIRNEQGDIAGLIGVARNIEQKRRAEEALRTAEERFHHLFDELSNESRSRSFSEKPAEVMMNDLAAGINDLAERMKVNLRHVMSFSSYASHELRAPLAILRLQLEDALKAKATQEELRIAVMSTYNEILRLTFVTNNLINLSTMQAGAYVPKFAPVEFRKYLVEFCKSAEPFARERKIALLTHDGPELTADLEIELFRQVLVNIVHNALKHVPEGGRIELQCSEEEGQLLLTIRDTGPGIPQKDLPKIFNTFYRGKDSQGEGGGAGLGLSLAKWIVQVHGGTIEVASEEGKGALFAIRVPLKHLAAAPQLQ